MLAKVFTTKSPRHKVLLAQRNPPKLTFEVEIWRFEWYKINVPSFLSARIP